VRVAELVPAWPDRVAISVNGPVDAVDLRTLNPVAACPPGYTKVSVIVV
jgi:hypothetical protein